MRDSKTLLLREMRCKRGTTKKLMQTQGGVLEALDISELNCTTRFICIVLYVLYRLICISEKKKTCCITRNSHPQGRSSIDYRISCLNLPAVSCFFTVSVRQVWNHLSPEEKTCLWAMNQETTIRSRVAMHCHGGDTTADSPRAGKGLRHGHARCLRSWMCFLSQSSHCHSEPPKLFHCQETSEGSF